MAGIDPSTPDRRMLRYQLVVNDQPTTLVPQSDPVHVAANRLGVGPDAAHIVEFWAEGTLDGFGAPRKFQVFGTGHVIPEGARYWGTAPRTPEGFVWHLYELEASDQSAKTDPKSQFFGPGWRGR